MRFVKKPVSVTAEQWFPSKKVAGVCGDRNNLWPCACLSQGGPGWVPHVHTTHTNQTILLEPGDWIIPEPNGQGYYPCKPDIFEATYEVASHGTLRFTLSEPLAVPAGGTVHIEFTRHADGRCEVHEAFVE